MKRFSVGVDIEKIKRFEEIIKTKNCKVLEKIFTKNELKYCFSKLKPAQHLTGKFAGKEATIKALHDVMVEKVDFKDIEIINNHEGIPQIKILSNKTINSKIKISISHSEDNAIAFVIIN
jgi:holo-[acyl-carrier protein] synthase